MPEERGLIEGGYSPKVLAWVIGIAVASFMLALILSAFEEQLGQPQSSEPDSYSRSAIGNKALIDFLEESGISVLVSRHNSVNKCGPRTPLLILAPDVEYVDGKAKGGQEVLSIAKLLGDAEARGVTVVLAAPKWQAVEIVNISGREGWVKSVKMVPVDDVKGYLHKTGKFELEGTGIYRSSKRAPSLVCQTSWGESLECHLVHPQLITNAPDIEPIVWTEQGILIGKLEDGVNPHDGHMYVISDPDLFNNQGLVQGDNAVSVHRLIGERIGAQGVVIDETHHGYLRVESLLAEMARFPLSLLTLHGLVVLALVLWAGFGRFGRPEAPPSQVDAGRQVLIDNTARLLSYGGHTGMSLARYFSLTVRLVGRHFSMPADMRLPDMTRRLQSMSEAREMKIDLIDLSKRIAVLRDKETRGQPQRAVRLAYLLYCWREEMLHGHRANR